MKKLLLTLFCVLAVGASALAATTYDATKLTTSSGNQENYNFPFGASSNITNLGTINAGNYTITVAQSGGSTAPQWNTAKDIRVYAKGTVTVATSGSNPITKIVFNISTQGKKRLAPITASNGTIATQASGDETVTWSGSTKTVTFTVGEKADYGSDGNTKAGQLCFDSIELTSGASGGGTTKPVVTAPSWKEGFPASFYTGTEVNFFDYLNMGDSQASEISFYLDDSTTGLTDGKYTFTAAGEHSVKASYKTDTEIAYLDSKKFTVKEKGALDPNAKSFFNFKDETIIHYNSTTGTGNLIENSNAQSATDAWFRDDYVKITLTKGTNNTYRYYPPTDFRLYKGAKMKFTAETGYLIKKITFDKGSDFTINGVTDGVYTPTTPAQSVELTNASGNGSKNSVIYSITIEYQTAVAVDPKWTVTKTEVEGFVYKDKLDPKKLLSDVEEGVPFVFRLMENDTNPVAAEADGTYIFPKAGSYMLYVSSEKSSSFNAKKEEMIMLTVGKAKSNLSFDKESLEVQVLDDPAEVTYPILTNLYDVPVTWVVATEDLEPTGEITIDENGKFTRFGKAGVYLVDASFAGNDNIEHSSDSYTLTVSNNLTVPQIEPAPVDGVVTLKCGESINITSQPKTKLEIMVDEEELISTETNEWAKTFDAVGTSSYIINAAYYNSVSEAIEFTVKVEKADAVLSWSDAEAKVTMGADDNVFPTLSNEANLAVVYSAEGTTADNKTIATIAEDGTITLLQGGDATITATFVGNDNYNAKTVSYVLHVIDPADLPPTSEFDFVNKTYSIPNATTASDASGNGQQKTAGKFSDTFCTVDLEHVNPESTADIYWHKTGESLRVYKAGKMTITPINGYAIKDVTFNFTKTDKAAIEGPDNSKTPENEKSYTYKPSSASKDAVVFTFSASTEITGFTVNYVRVAELKVPTTDQSIDWGGVINDFEFANSTAITDDAVVVEIKYVPANTEDAQVPSEAELTAWYLSHTGEPAANANYDAMLAFANSYLDEHPNCDAWVNADRQPSAEINEEGHLVIKAPASGKYAVTLKTNQKHVDAGKYAAETSETFYVNVLPSLDGFKVNWVELNAAEPGENQTITILKSNEPQTIHVDIDAMFATLFWKFKADPTYPEVEYRPSLRANAAAGFDVSDGSWAAYDAHKIQVSGPGTLELAVSKNGQTSYLGSFNVVETNDNDAVTGVDTIVVGNADVRFFTLDGVEVGADRLASGLYIRVAGGKAVKVLVK